MSQYSPTNGQLPGSERRTELLSAYLDEALAPTEKTQVEQLLAADPTARQQLEGLRGVRLGLRQLEPLAPPPTLDVATVRRMALLAPKRGLLADFEDHFTGMGRQSTFLLLFALIVAFALLMWNFAAYWNDPTRHFTRLELSPEGLGTDNGLGVRELDLEHATTVLVGAKVFHREGTLWIEDGIDRQKPPRLVLSDSGEGQRLLARRPDLRGAMALGEILVEVDGELLHLKAVARPVGGL